MSEIRWGLVSTANINRRVIPAIHESARGRLTAVASRSLASAEAYAAEWEIAHAFGSYEAMLQSDEVDAVYISLPNYLHAQWTIYALQHGKHVLCEKPFATTVAEVDEMIAAAADTGNVLAEAFMYRHHPQTKIAQEWVKDGRLGEVRLVRSIFSFSMGSRNNIRLVPEWGGGSLWDVGVYPLSFAQCIYGAVPTTVWGNQWVGESGVDEFFSGQMAYADGRVAQISSSFCTPFYTMAEVVGTDGRLTLNRPFTGHNDGARRMLFHPPDGEPEEIPVPQKSLYLGEVEDMHAAILDGAPNFLSLTETRDHVRTALALYKSAGSGKAVQL